MARNNTHHLHRRRRHEAPRPLLPLWLWLVGFLGVALLGTLSLTGAAAAGLYFYVIQDMASPETIVQRQVAESTFIYDRNGRLLNEIFDPRGGRRTMVPLSQISPYLRQATIATEDADFYRNTGINIRGSMRAVLETLQGRVQGGSSITQQLVKNVLIPPEERFQRSILRKIKESILAFEITRRYPKDKILEWYLNEVNYGNLSYGIEAAAKGYFGKPAKDLNLAESSLLAGLPQAPAWYSPLVDMKRAKERQTTVLNLMVRQGFVTPTEAEEAKEAKLELKSREFSLEAPHFVMYVRGLLEEKYGTEALYQGGLKVTTSLDLELQQQAEAIVHEKIQELEKVYDAHNAGLVAIRPTTGEILAMVGSADFNNEAIDGQVNMATAERQPGSSFKPFTYVTAFAKGYSPATMVLDVRSSFPDGANPPYVPDNVDFKFRGPVSVRTALSNSLNIPAVRTLSFAGIKDVIDTAHKMGITGLNRKDYGLALTLGGGEVKLMDMVYAYSIFANGGKMAGTPVPQQRLKSGFRTLDPVAILKVTDAKGRVLEEFTRPSIQPVVSPQLAYLITDILSDNNARAASFGYNTPLRLSNRQAGVKTGTTTDWRDNWTIGYTPQLATGIWVGNTDNKPMKKALSFATAAPLWNAFMETALKNTPPSSFSVPPGLVKATVCVPSGLLPTSSCSKTATEIFLEEAVPRRTDSIWQTFKIDQRTGLLANATTPPQFVAEKVFMILPPEAQDWVRENGIPQPPTEYSYYSSSPVAITSPAPGSFIGHVLEVKGSASSDSFVRFGLEYGEGLAPSRWLALGPLQDKPVRDGILGKFDVSHLNGLYTLRLTVMDSKRGLIYSTVPLTVDNADPQVEISYPNPGMTLKIDGEEQVGIQAKVNDNYGVQRVEFFVDEQPLGFTTVFPYNRQWRLTAGTHIILAVAYDKAGNWQKSPPVTVNVR